MSAFSDSSFSSDRYSSARPRYPQTLYDCIFEYHALHSSSTMTAIDIACGTGEATFPLSAHFSSVIGVDISSVMVQRARKLYPDLTFHVSPAETFVKNLSIAPHSVDLITVAEGIHWFDFVAFYKEVYLALKPNATLAFWGYCDAAIDNYPEASQLILDYCYDDKYLGSYWQLPGRQLVRDRIPVNPTSSLFTNVCRYENVVCKSNLPPVNGNSQTFVLNKTMTVAQVREYARTFSAYHSWKKANPDAPDIITECFETLKSTYGWSESTTLSLTWDTFLVLAQRV